MNTLEKYFIKVGVWLIELYQRTLSPDHGPNHRPTCRFSPSCSEYTKKAVVRFGFLGVLLGFWRIARCNPLLTKTGTYEEVPNELKIGRFTIKSNLRN